MKAWQCEEAAENGEKLANVMTVAWRNENQ
jgi:hypothetical protein